MFLLGVFVLALGNVVDLAALTPEQRVQHLEALLAEARAAVASTPGGASGAPVPTPTRSIDSAGAPAKPVPSPPGGAPLPPDHGFPFPPLGAGGPPGGFPGGFPGGMPPPGPGGRPPLPPDGFKTATGYMPPPPLPPMPHELRKYQVDKMVKERDQSLAAAAAAAAAEPAGAAVRTPSPPGGPAVEPEDVYEVKDEL